MLVILYGPQRLARPLARSRLGIRVVYAWPGMVLATMFVTLPFVVREVVPVLREFGVDQEEVAYTLGAGRWRTFWRVTLPSIRWGLAYGVTLTVARSLGEFGALLVVSGNILGRTQTATLYIHDGIESFHTEGAYAASVAPGRRLVRPADRHGAAPQAGRAPREAGMIGERPARVRPRRPAARPAGRDRRRRSWASRSGTSRSGSATSRPSTTSRSRSRPASSWRCSGPSGSGKSTILRIIAGLEPADSGDVELTGEDATNLPVQRRGVGFVFQHYALFRHMTIRQNVAFGLEVQKPRRRPRSAAGRRAARPGPALRATPSATRRSSRAASGSGWRWPGPWPRGPRSCSSTSRSARSTRKVRDELRTWLRKLHDEVHVTSLFVTHDQQEAFEVSDQIVVLNKGKVEQMGPPQELYEHPATPFVTEFLGSVNVLPVETVLAMDLIGDEAPLPLDLPGPDGPVARSTSARTTSRSPASATAAPPGPPGSAA